MGQRGAMVPVTDGINSLEHWTARRRRVPYFHWRNYNSVNERQDKK